jgi:hypothetical protein
MSDFAIINDIPTAFQYKDYHILTFILVATMDVQTICNMHQGKIFNNL